MSNWAGERWGPTKQVARNNRNACAGIGPCGTDVNGVLWDGTFVLTATDENDDTYLVLHRP